MGLLAGLATLPLAPLRGVIALARQLQQQAAQQTEQEIAQLRAELLGLQLRYEHGELPQEDVAHKEAELLEKVGALVGAGGGDR